MRKATVAIAGAGMVGSYLHRILERSGIPADLYTGRSPSLNDWRAFMKMEKRMGAELSLKEAISMLSFVVR